jgi:hypothetical protein
MPRAGAPLTDGAAGFTVTITYTQSRTIVRSAAWKSVHGFDLAADAPPAARKPQKLRLDPSITLDEAFATILHSCLHRTTRTASSVAAFPRVSARLVYMPAAYSW